MDNRQRTSQFVLSVLVFPFTYLGALIFAVTYAGLGMAPRNAELVVFLGTGLFGGLESIVEDKTLQAVFQVLIVTIFQVLGINKSVLPYWRSFTSAVTITVIIILFAAILNLDFPVGRDEFFVCWIGVLISTLMSQFFVLRYISAEILQKHWVWSLAFLGAHIIAAIVPM